MPSIMDAMDALLEPKDVQRSQHADNFPNLSANVQKILANLPPHNQDDASAPSAEMSHNGGGSNRNSMRVRNSVFYTSLTPRQKSQFAQMASHRNKSTESLDIISPGVQKMLANLPDTELAVRLAQTDLQAENKMADNDRSRINTNKAELNNNDHENNRLRSDCKDYDKSASSGGLFVGEPCENGNSQPLGTYMQKPSGIASRTPVGRKNMGKYLQIPSESTNSTLSSEVSRPVSLTSLGSCSSSSSSGLHQQGSAYLASAESLDSDNEPTGSQGSADSGIAESTTTGADMRVLHEVLDTEAIYVDDLHQVIKGYLEPWRNDPSCPLGQHLPHLFSNLEAIYEFNNKFLQHLRSVPLDSTHVANAFLLHDSGFSIYTEYCTNYPRTMNILTEMTRDESMAALFRERQGALHHALPLGSYLLKPVQRILKYHLFLQRLSKQCDEHHRCSVDLALATMTAVATHINTMKRKHEHAVRVHEIQAQLYGWHGDALTALGELIAEGTFRVGGARGRRHVFLFDKLLMMAKSKPDGALGYKTHIMCSNLMLVEQVRGEPLSFHVLPFDNPRNQYTLRARSTQHKREWTLQIKRVILENYNAVIPNHARQLVMQLGQDMPECTEEQYDKSSPIKQHTTPQYLERRGRFRKTRDFSVRRATSQDRTFPSLGKWRRQSDPSGCQYKTAKKSPKAKKSPDSSVFYTDLSDSENCEGLIGASMDSLNVIQEQERQERPHEQRFESPERDDKQHLSNTIAQVVTDLLMQNVEFHKVLSKQRRNMKGSHSCYGNSKQYEQSDEGGINKSDSLPRSFQLNDKNAEDKDEDLCSTITTCESISSLQECSDQRENDDDDDEEEYPEHKIYRKSTMRLSILQRFRAILNEDGRSKLPTHKLGSKSMGAKIANPDYADPQKILLVATEPRSISNSPSTSTTTLPSKDNLEDFVLPRNIDMNEAEVLRELDRRLSQQPTASNGQRMTSSPKTPTSPTSPTSPMSPISPNPAHVFATVASSHDCYYEHLLDKRLTEEESRIEKSDSFRSNAGDDCRPHIMRKPEMKRPVKAPPPIPAKPKFLSPVKNSLTAGNPINSNGVCQNGGQPSNCGLQLEGNQKGWVKTIIDRFE